MKTILFNVFFIVGALLGYNLQADEAATNNPTAAQHIDQANNLAHQNMHEAALSEVNQAVTMDPYNPRAFKIRGNIHYTMGNYYLALQDFNRFVELAPNVALPYVDRAIIHFTLGNIDQAKQDIDHALTIQPGSEFAKAVRAQIYSDTTVPAKKQPFKTKK